MKPSNAPPGIAPALEQATGSETVLAMRAAAERAALETLPRFRRPIEIDDKGGERGFDPVTEADRAAEAVIRHALLQRFPHYGFLGEESAPTDAPGQPCWVVDPIDGTRAFITGMPLWGTLIALNEAGIPTYGLLDQPFLGECYLGTPAGSVLIDRNGTRVLQCRADHRLDMAVLQCTHPAMFDTLALQRGFERVSRRVKLVRYGGDCYSYALLALGFIDLVIECHLQPYDIQALEPIVHGAGGVVSDWSGGPASHGGSVVAAASASLHAQALALLQER